jgi:type I restriction enzyme S subunit
MSVKWPRGKFGEFLNPNSRPYVLGADEDANLVGMRLYGEGPFHRELKPAMRIAKKSHFVIKAGDVIYNKLFAWKGTFGVVPSALDGMFVSDKFPTYELDRNKVDENWLRWYFRCRPLWDEAQTMSTGSAALSKLTLNPPKFLLLTMPVPPLDEQQRIAARIEELAGKIEEAQELRKEAAEETEVLWAGGAKRIFERAEGRFPLCSLADVVSIAGGGTPSKTNPFYWSGSIPWITPKDMKVRQLHDSIDHISEQATVESAAKLIEPGAVLVVVRGMILVHTFPSALLRVPATINQDMKALTPKADLLPEYLCAFFWAFNDRVLALVEKSTHDTRKLETNVLVNIKLPVPPLPEQRRIILRLDELQQQTDSLKALQKDTSVELDAIMPSILDKAFRGEL